jgi:hypothetical protein
LNYRFSKGLNSEHGLCCFHSQDIGSDKNGTLDTGLFNS